MGGGKDDMRHGGVIGRWAAKGLCGCGAAAERRGGRGRSEEYSVLFAMVTGEAGAKGEGAEVRKTGMDACWSLATSGTQARSIALLTRSRFVAALRVRVRRRRLRMHDARGIASAFAFATSSTPVFLRCGGKGGTGEVCSGSTKSIRGRGWWKWGLGGAFEALGEHQVGKETKMKYCRERIVSVRSHFAFRCISSEWVSSFGAKMRCLVDMFAKVACMQGLDKF